MTPANSLLSSVAPTPFLFTRFRPTRVLHESAKSLVLECVDVGEAPAPSTSSTSSPTVVVLKLLLDRLRWESEIAARSSAAALSYAWSGSDAARTVGCAVRALCRRHRHSSFLASLPAEADGASVVVYGIALAAGRGDLAHTLAHAPRSPAASIEIIRSVAETVRTMHRAGFAHCALRAPHVIAREGGGGWTLAGLGSCEPIAAFNPTSARTAGRKPAAADDDGQYRREGRRRSIRRRRQLFVGAGSMSPELWRETFERSGGASAVGAPHALSAADDVFSLGILAYELFTPGAALFRTDAEGNFLERSDAQRLRGWDGLRQHELDLVFARTCERVPTAAEPISRTSRARAKRLRQTLARGLLAWALAADALARPRSIDEFLAHPLFGDDRAATARRPTMLTVNFAPPDAAPDAAGAAGGETGGSAGSEAEAEAEDGGTVDGGWSVHSVQCIADLQRRLHGCDARVLVLSGCEGGGNDGAVAVSLLSGLSPAAALTPPSPPPPAAPTVADAAEALLLVHEQEMRELDSQLEELSNFEVEYAALKAAHDDTLSRLDESGGAAGALGDDPDGSPARASSQALAQIEVPPPMDRASSLASSQLRIEGGVVGAADFAELLRPPHAPFLECVVVLAKGSMPLACAMADALRHVVFVAWDDDERAPLAAGEHFVSELFVALRGAALDSEADGEAVSLSHAFCTAAAAVSKSDSSSAAVPLWLRGGAGASGRDASRSTARDLAALRAPTSAATLLRSAQGIVSLDELHGEVRELHALLRRFTQQQLDSALRTRRGNGGSADDADLVRDAARHAGELTAAVAQLRSERARRANGSDDAAASAVLTPPHTPQGASTSVAISPARSALSPMTPAASSSSYVDEDGGAGNENELGMGDAYAGLGDEAAWSSDDDKEWDDRDDEVIKVATTKMHWLRGELPRTFCISAVDIATLNTSTGRETMRCPLEEVIWVGESKTDPLLFKLRVKQGKRARPRQLQFKAESKADKERLVATLSMLVHAHRTKRHRTRSEAQSGFWTGGEVGAVVRVKKPVRRRSMLPSVGEDGANAAERPSDG